MASVIVAAPGGSAPVRVVGSSISGTVQVLGMPGPAAPTPAGAAWRTTRDPAVGWLTHAPSDLSTVGSINNATFAPLIIGAAGSYSELCVYCQAGAAGKTLRVALYRAATDNLIGERVIDFGAAALDAAGFKSLTVAPVALAAGIYYVLMQVSGGSPTFRGGAAPAWTGSGLTSSILQGAGIGRVVSLDYATAWPADMTAYTIGVMADQLQLVGSYFAPAALLR